jgi:DNA-binding transcriptional LysR family regulator
MDIRKVDLNLLVVFDMLLQKQNVSRAAEALDMSQPALSFALNKLRTMFDDPLFVRASRGVRPTPLAEQLAGPLHHVLDQIRNTVLQGPQFDPATTQRSFTLNMADVGELVFLPKLYAHLAGVAPGVALNTAYTPPGALEQALEAGEVDLAIGYFPFLQGASVYQQRLFSHGFVCLVRKDHPSIGAQMSKAQFLAARHMTVYREGKQTALVDEFLEAEGLPRRIVLRVPHFLSIPSIIGSSDLVVVVPYAVGLICVGMANLKMVRPPLRMPQADVKQFWHARFHHDQASIWLRGQVAGLFGEGAKARGAGRAAASTVLRTG